MIVRASVRWLSLLVCLTSWAPTARAEIESDAVKEGVRAYDSLDYPAAVQALQSALSESLTRDEKIITYRTLGFAQVALDHNDEARAAFASLLRLDPAYELDRTISPRIRAVFEQARGDVATSGAGAEADARLPSMTPAVSPARGADGKLISVTVSHPGGIAQTAQLYYRERGTSSFSRVDGKRSGDEGRFELAIPGLAVKAPGLDYYVVALDEHGAAVARAGSLSAPLSIDVAARPRPVYKRGWFWGVMGVVVAAAVAGGVVGALVHPVGPNTPASVTLTPQ
jgi:hypothetical protein